MTTKTAAHDVQVGDVFKETWGYDQTNVDFYEVVKTTPSGVWLRKLQVSTVGSSGTDNLVYPKRGHYADEWRTNGHTNDPTDKPFFKRVKASYDGKPRVRLTSYSSGFLWNGDVARETHPLYGH